MLRGIVENLHLFVLSGGRSDDVFQRLALELRSCDKFVERLNIRLVVLSVMKANRLR